jgi:two-component system, chemotaxis family, sensor kinase CheA
MTEVLREFILETSENLAQLDTDLITLEKSPGDRSTLASAFRTLHSIKGTAGFVGLPKLQSVAHAAENLLSRLRSGEITFNRTIATALLGVVDAIRDVIGSVEKEGNEGQGDYANLITQLDHLYENGGKSSPELASVLQSLPPTPLRSEASMASTQSFHDLPSSTPEPVEEPAPATTETTRNATVADNSIRVDVGILDNLMNLVGELVLARNQIVQHSVGYSDSGFLGTVQRLNLLTSELQAGVMKTRMQPISTVWSKFPRVVRDLAVACGKKVRFDMEGQGTELDKTILEAIRDPLTHMVRNAVDHGIEPTNVRQLNGKSAEGRLSLHAFHEGGKVVVVIQDDGGGIDPARVREKALRSKLLTPEEAATLSDSEAINLIFMPGFSTSEKVTQFSGRGVGMDVVRTNVEKIGGTVDVESQLGIGTSVKMRIPLTLAIIPALSVSCAGERFCIPQVNLLELVRIESDQISNKVENIHGTPVYRLRGNLLPIVYLSEQLKLTSTRTNNRDLFVVVLQADDRKLGLVVDAIHDTEEIVVKPLQKQHKNLTVFAGATIMGDGRVALILDVIGIAGRAGVISGRRGRGISETAAPTAPAIVLQSLLVFGSTDGGRMAIPLPSVARLEEFPTAILEQVGPRCMVQYRGEILRLVDISHELDRMQNPGRTAVPLKARELTQVVVCSEEGFHVGLVVETIFDIVEEELTAQSKATRPGVLFNAVVQGRVTEFPDIVEILRASKI